MLTESGYMLVTCHPETDKGLHEKSRNPLILLVERKGIEPSTFALRTRRSPS